MHILIFKSLTLDDSDKTFQPEYLVEVQGNNRVINSRDARDAKKFQTQELAKKFLQMNAIAFAWTTIQIPEN